MKVIKSEIPSADLNQFHIKTEPTFHESDSFGMEVYPEETMGSFHNVKLEHDKATVYNFDKKNLNQHLETDHYMEANEPICKVKTETIYCKEEILEDSCGNEGTSDSNKPLYEETYNINQCVIHKEEILEDFCLDSFDNDQQMEINENLPPLNVNKPICENNSNENINDKYEHSYCCYKCNKCFKLKYQLKAHIARHTNERSYSCFTCKSVFYRKDVLKNHVLIHRSKPLYSCLSCGKSFNRASHLKKHTLIHSKERPFSCEVCGKRFTQKPSLTTHLLCHTNDRPHVCLTCGKSYKSKAVLRRHTFIHTKDRRYFCSMCSKSFSRSHDLKRHMVVHTNADIIKV